MSLKILNQEDELKNKDTNERTRKEIKNSRICTPVNTGGNTGGNVNVNTGGNVTVYDLLKNRFSKIS